MPLGERGSGGGGPLRLSRPGAYGQSASNGPRLLVKGTDMRRLTGRTAIVTGGASGFGAGIVRRFVAEGARVAVVDVNGAAAEALALELGDAASAMVADVSRDADMGRLAAQAGVALGQI